VIKLLKP